MRLDRDEYLIAQRLYRGWALAGIPLTGAMIAILWLALSSSGLSSAASIIAFSLLAVTLLLFFAWIRPVNVETHGWTIAPPHWQTLRRRWEFGHAANAWLTLGALVAVISSAVTS